MASDTDAESAGERQLFAFLEKRQNASVVGSTPQTYQMTTTRLDPLTYMLFGAYKLEVVERGIECDGWLPIVGNLDALDDVQRLKISMDACMLRVFEGITMARRQRPRPPTLSRDEEPREDEDDEQGRRNLSLSRNEIKELDYLSRDIVNILKTYASEREQFQSRASSRSVTPIGSPIGSPPSIPCDSPDHRPATPPLLTTVRASSSVVSSLQLTNDGTSLLRTFEVPGFANWKRRESTKKWRIYGRSSKVWFRVK
ncbi:P-loop containing nucleoside triphosphate hydrolase protein [Salix suchowensis]|nr:P-loop containing nucleoside triphosphate hydrolase protein [Salix suchowensis]